MRQRLNHAAFAAIMALGLACGAQAEPAAETPDLGSALEKHVGEVLDLVELSTGKRFVRPKLQGVNERGGRVVSLRLDLEGESKTQTVLLAHVVKVIAGRETVYEARPKNRSAMGLKAQKLREAYEREQEASAKRMAGRGVAAWPQLSREEHESAVRELEAFVEQARGAFPNLRSSSTHEFLVATDIPPAQMAPFVAKLDSMHDLLCDLYGIPTGEPVWRGKCLVVAFDSEQDFLAFEHRFMGGVPKGVHGVCHQRDDGRVVMACHRGNDELAFAHMLVHETSHGFNHRWLSPTRMPSWLNEGIAEWIGTQVVPACTQVRIKEAQAAEYVRAGGGLGANFFSEDADAKIEPIQYGIASALVRFMVTQNRREFAAFVRGVKEGAGVAESLDATFHAKVEDLAKSYAAGIGMPAAAP